MDREEIISELVREFDATIGESSFEIQDYKENLESMTDEDLEDQFFEVFSVFPNEFEDAEAV